MWLAYYSFACGGIPFVPLRLYVSVYANQQIYEQCTEQAIPVTTRYLYVLLFIELLEFLNL